MAITEVRVPLSRVEEGFESIKQLEGFLALVEKVREHSEEAADYLEQQFTLWMDDERDKLVERFDPLEMEGHPISSLFIWNSSPQGHAFWNNLNKKIFFG